MKTRSAQAAKFAVGILRLLIDGAPVCFEIAPERHPINRCSWLDSPGLRVTVTTDA